MGQGSRWGTHVHSWLIHVNVWQKPLQYYKVISLQLKFKLKKKDCLHPWKLASLFSSVKVNTTSENFVGTLLSAKQLTRNEAQDL